MFCPLKQKKNDSTDLYRQPAPAAPAPLPPQQQGNIYAQVTNTVNGPPEPDDR